MNRQHFRLFQGLEYRMFIFSSGASAAVVYHQTLHGVQTTFLFCDHLNYSYNYVEGKQLL